MTENQPIKQDELPETEKPHSAGEKHEERGESIMCTSVKFSNQDMNLLVCELSLVIEELNGLEKEKTSKSKGLNFRWCEIITAQNSSEKDTQNQMLTLHYMEKQKNKSLRVKSVTLKVTGDNFDSILSSIQDQCQKVPNRPKKLFVLINPIGGNRKGVEIYEKKIAPIFALANCETTVKISERAKHALEIGETQDFTGYDGIICVSGDGLYQELLEGYLKQLQKAHGVDINDPKAKIVKPNIPFCLIPAGSSNGTVRYTNDGVIDLETSALRVLRGEIHSLNIVTVHEPGKIIGVCGLAFGIGLITDLLKHSDERRWMKKARYVYSIAAVLLKRRRMYDAQVDYILDEDESEGAHSAQDGAVQPRKEWTEFNPDGKRYACTAFLVSRMVNLGNKTIVDPYSNSGALILDTGCSNFGFFKYTRTMLGQSPAGEIANLHIKDKAVGLRIKILRDEAVSSEKDKTVGLKEEDAKQADEEETGNRGDSEGVSELDNVAKTEKSESSKSVETVEPGEGGGEVEQIEEDSKTDPAKGSGGKSEAGKKRNRKAEAAAARDSELEHYIYLDGEIKRVDGLEFECRLHSSFVPMFGCVASELVDAKSE
ncbi:hypothetical protein RRG08_003791 [Elysia crispata]|uniref:DAGKc domain-containing protein n=1 Tax=Elysia crispata TaxID=231223 RepID=A0AAE1AWI3_9GAST|nr:hypothetical protein RRG08_003791 [Elysia crispata]